MNLLLASLMDEPSVLSVRCTMPGCESTYRLENHHIVNRSQGGTDGPRRTLCFDHHELCRLHILHFRYADCWEHLFTEEPTKYERALDMPGWQSTDDRGLRTDKEIA